MGYDKFTGIISKETNTGDADRYLTILTMESGKIECYAKGIRNQKSKLSASAGLFCFGEYQLFKKSTSYTLTSAKLIENFFNIRNDIVRLTYAIHFLEVARDIILDGQPFPDAVKMLLNSLYMLSRADKSPCLVSRVFELRMLSLSGFSPVLEKCVSCGDVILNNDPNISFSVPGFGIICGKCKQKPGVRKSYSVSSGTLQSLKHIVESRAQDVFNFNVSENVQDELSQIIPAYLRYNMESDYTKLDYLKTLI